MATGKLSAMTFPCSISCAIGGGAIPWRPSGFAVGSYRVLGGQNVCFTLGLSSNNEMNTLMPLTMEVRSLGSMRIQSSSNHRFTASNCCCLRASVGEGWTPQPETRFGAT